jgi:hypothetical protein
MKRIRLKVFKSFLFIYFYILSGNNGEVGNNTIHNCPFGFRWDDSYKVDDFCSEY